MIHACSFGLQNSLTAAEENLLIDFAAYRRMVADSMGQETERARTILDWVQSRLREGIGTIYRIVPDTYGRGRITAADHSNLSFTPQGELPSILSPLISQILDSVYESRDLVFEAPAPFNDTNAVNVINGAVKLGVFERNARVSKELSASQNYGFALGIMRRPNDRKLELSECRYSKDIADWIKEKLGDTGAGMPAGTLYKNFMGIGGPGGLNYGLSKKLVQLYLLCLVREGQLRITISGRNQPVDVIDYSNIASIDFKASVLDGFDMVQRLKPPDGWEVLAPFAAVLLKDESIRTVNEDADIHLAIQRVLDYKKQECEPYKKSLSNLVELFDDAEASIPGASTGAQALLTRLNAWQKFLEVHVEPGDPIPYLRSALYQAFGYPIFHESEVRQEDVDDLTARRVEMEQARNFLGFREDFRTALRYISASLADVAALAEVNAVLSRAGRDLKNRLDKWVRNEAAFRSEFLDPVGSAIETYRVRYLQIFDQVESHTEQVRQEIQELIKGSEYQAISALAKVKPLGSDPRGQIQSTLDAAVTSSELLPARLTRAGVERDLKLNPYPANCPLTFANAQVFMRAADDALDQSKLTLHEILLYKARLLTSPALRARLEAGREHSFISGLLLCDDAGGVAAYLTEHLGQAEPDTVEHNVALLQQYLRKVIIHRISLGDFNPSKTHH